MNNKKPIPKDSESRIRARELRNHSTKEENHLWYDFLRSFPIRFHRQYVIESYIVDFFCPKAKLIVELDGSQHYTPEAKQYDMLRTKILEGYGFKVLRYTNQDIHRRFRAVCDDIYAQASSRMNDCLSEN